MPKSGAFINEMYQSWYDASPAKPFPFQHGDIKYSWSDVKTRIERDINKPALTFTTGHFTPGVGQSLVLTDMYKKEKWHQAKRALSSTASHSSGSPGSTLSAASPTQSLGPNSPNSSTSPKGHQRSLREELTKKEAEMLYNSEGGGHGRTSFLKDRKAKPPISRYKLPLLSSHVFGWEIDRENQIKEGIKNLQNTDPQEAARQLAENEKLKSQTAREYHMRKAGMKDLERSCGVFHPPEFSVAFPPVK